MGYKEKQQQQQVLLPQQQADAVPRTTNGQLSPEVAGIVYAKIERSVRRFMDKSKALSEKVTECTLAPFERDEIELGKILGSGGFNHVLEIKSFSPRQQSDLTPHEEFLRQSVLDTKSSSKCFGGASSSPFVVKHMKPKFLDLPNKFKNAGADLVIEAHFLASLQHEHILQIRGWTKGGIHSYIDGCNDGFFLIVDRLQETLDDRIKQWNKQLRRYYKHPVLEKMNINMQEFLFSGRLKVARDIASGLAYLHSKGIIYRDLKPGNVGFDANGQVKIFDFGLSRELPTTPVGAKQDKQEEEEKGEKTNGFYEIDFIEPENQVFDMSGKVGTQRYMSPEVCKQEPYNQKTDVYSLSLVIWEMLSLEKPFKNHSKGMHKMGVVEKGERPKISQSWPQGIQTLLSASWNPHIRIRPTMQQVVDKLDCEVYILRKISNPDDEKSMSNNNNNNNNVGCLRRRRTWGSKLAFRKADSSASIDTADSTFLSTLTGESLEP